MSLVVEIKKSFPDFSLDVSFSSHGDINALFGLSGSGKSLTLRCISGIIKPDFGKIVIDGETVFDSDKKINIIPQKRNIGYLPQNFALFPNMSVQQNILAGLRNTPRKDRLNKLEDLLGRFDLYSIRDKYIQQISGGEKQRVALARTLATDPKVLLLDEPFSALDTQIKTRLELDLINLLNNFTGDVVFVSHNKDEVYKICNRVSVIDNGYCRNSRNTESVFNKPLTKADAVLIGLENISNIIATENTYSTDFEFDVPLKDKDINCVGFNLSEYNIGKVDSDIVFEAFITNVIRSTDCSWLVAKVSDFSKPVFLKTKADRTDFVTGAILTIGLDVKDIYYLK